MFFIVNKDKIISCVIALTTVLVLFLLANGFRPNEKAVATSGKLEKELPVYRVDIKDMKVSLTINCAW